MRQPIKRKSEYSILYKSTNGGRTSDPRYYIDLNNKELEEIKLSDLLYIRLSIRTYIIFTLSFLITIYSNRLKQIIIYIFNEYFRRSIFE